MTRLGLLGAGSVTILAAMLCPSSGKAIVLKTGDAGVPSGSRPADNVIGQWSNNGSCVAIDPNHIICVGHVNTGNAVGTNVTFGGVAYVVSSDTFIGSADLRVCKITQTNGSPANLTQYTPVYASSTLGQNIVLGGFGQGNGGAVNNSTGSGYAWDGAGNTTERWGTNYVQQSAANVNLTGYSYVSNVLLDLFDDTGAPHVTTHEGAIAQYDSGGGWFVNDAGIWKVAALNEATEHSGTSYYLVNSEGRGDVNQAVDLSSYASQINAAVPEPGSIALLGLAGAGLLTRRRRASFH